MSPAAGAAGDGPASPSQLPEYAWYEAPGTKLLCVHPVTGAAVVGGAVVAGVVVGDAVEATVGGAVGVAVVLGASVAGTVVAASVTGTVAGGGVVAAASGSSSSPPHAARDTNNAKATPARLCMSAEGMRATRGDAVFCDV
jgi:hypothetical protein